MQKIFVLIQKGIECPFFIRPERTPSQRDACLPCTMLGSGPAGRQGRGASRNG